MDGETIILKIRRRDDPEGLSYWEKFEVPYEQGMTVAQALQKIVPTVREDSEEEAVKISAPVFEMSCLEGSCGACAMVINGKTALACRTFIDDLSGSIIIEPLPKFAVKRDLVVDRSSMDDSVKDFHAYAIFDGFDVSCSCRSRILKKSQARKFDGCIMCGICCESFPKNSNANSYAGAFIMARLSLLELNSFTQVQSKDRLRSAAKKGGIPDSAAFSLCEIRCPAQIDLASAAAIVGGRTLYCALADFFQNV